VTRGPGAATIEQGGGGDSESTTQCISVSSHGAVTGQQAMAKLTGLFSPRSFSSPVDINSSTLCYYFSVFNEHYFQKTASDLQKITSVISSNFKVGSLGNLTDDRFQRFNSEQLNTRYDISSTNLQPSKTVKGYQYSHNYHEVTRTIQAT
jgi:hypothetical protein